MGQPRAAEFALKAADASAAAELAVSLVVASAASAANAATASVEVAKAIAAAGTAAELATTALAAMTGATSEADVAVAEHLAAAFAASSARSLLPAKPAQLADGCVLLKPSTAVTFLVQPAIGQCRELLVTKASGQPKRKVFLQTAGYNAKGVMMVPAPAGDNKGCRPGAWVVVGDEPFVITMPGYDDWGTSKPALGLCLSTPPLYLNHTLTRLRHVRIRGDQVPWHSLSLLSWLCVRHM